ncbi:helix-turn-helix transcriptional regulator [Rhodobacter maris]|uniref:AraC-like DNA-binding protein n=1 Tax=Rhodobacter maris TaxID=446682 RepID=A0A285ST88_9RHOB|nr:helix-turn-helix transcriptional regulator [Rhodobacter maris]SOC11610.1 AraC-like DNA-binding protein [Rhodobacter maris]
MTKPILLGDIAAGAHHSGVDFGATIRPERVALEGRRRAGEIASGLRLHTLDAVAATDFETRLMRTAGLVLHLVLAGEVEAFIGPHPLRLTRQGDAPVRIAFYALAAPAPFRRRARAGSLLRKVSIDLSWDWLAARGVHVETVLDGAAFRHEDWPATAAEIGMAERLLALDRAEPGPQAALAREALALTLVAGLAERLLSAPGALRPSERDRLSRIEAAALRPGPVPDLAQIAATAGLSLSSLQRLFQRAYGVSAKERLRSLRMERAATALREGVAVAQAAEVAGFVSVESFATAFRRRYGIAPSSVLGPAPSGDGKRPRAFRC